MKTFSTFTFCLALVLVGTRTQAASTDTGQTSPTSVPAPTPYQIVSKGANFNIWQWQTFEALPNGQIVAHPHQYAELASGLNYPDPATPGQWLPSQELIQPYSQGAIAQQGQTKVIFANNINTVGAIDVETPEGRRLVSNVIGLMYVDSTTGQSVQIAEVQDSEGQLVAANQVLYTNAFNGVKASIRYKYRRDGVEQDIILAAQPPPPESFGLKSETAELVAVTEFINPPEASVFGVGTDAEGAEPDQAVSWGATSLGRGKAFSLAGQDVPVIVRKQYANFGGRYFLFEKVRYREIQKAVSSLPQQASTVRGLPGMASRHLRLPKAAAGNQAVRPMRLALSQMPDKGYVLDYITLNSAYTNYTFQGDTCYYVSGNLNLSGTNNIFEGGTVIKYATNASITIIPGGAAKFMSAPYHPVVFSSKDDNTIGQTISGSTGSPSGYYADPALNLSSLGSLALSEFRIAYANRGLSGSGASPAIYDAQFVNCATAISDLSGNLSLENVLLSNIKTNFNATSSTNAIYVQNATFNNAFDLIDGSFTNTWLYLTNCVFVNVTNLSGNLLAGYNGFYQTPMVGAPSVTNTFYPLQQAGAASCYLTNGCAFLTNGTAGVDPYGLSLTQRKTTAAPLIFSNLTFSVITNFGPYVPRDTNATPTLGYHYDPLDYAFGGVSVYSNITFSAGTAVGWFELRLSGHYGITMYDKVVLSFNGTASQPCTMARYCTVQEGGDGLWKTLGSQGAIVTASLSGGYGMSPTNAAMTRVNFTRHALLCEGPNHYCENNALSQVFAQNSVFWDGNIGVYWDEMSATNCLFDRVLLGVNGSNPALWRMRNCTVRGGNLTLSEYNQTWPVWIEDCAFDGTTFSVDNNSSGNTNETYMDFNAFMTGSNSLSAPGTHNVYVTNFNWQSSRYGYFFLPANSPLIDQGSTTADQFGLYHFTTQTTQMKETNSIVDIGYHYVTIDGNGNPADSNGDGIPDYLEDGNGDGLVDNGESPWMPPPVITAQLTNLMIIQGSNAIFSFTVTSLVPANYQWYFNGTNLLAGATNACLTLTNVQPANAGIYSATISNPAGVTASSNALLSVMTWTNDADYDGRSDAQEILDGTDPYNPNSVLPVEMARWSFANTNTWCGDEGQLPLLSSNLTGIPCWYTNAVNIDSTNPAILCYRDAETNGSANINLRCGTIHFWFAPDWSSVNAGGNGPGSAGRLIEVGNYNPVSTGNNGAVSFTNGWWALYFSPDGTQLSFGTSTNGVGVTNLTANITWTSNLWYEVFLTYTPTNSLLYIGRQLVTNGSGPIYYPNITERSNGFRIGSDATGTNQGAGSFEYLEAYNYALSTSVITNWPSSAVGNQIGGSGNGIVCYPVSYYTPVSPPGLFPGFSLPEPGLVNEPFTISGVIAQYAGVLDWTYGSTCGSTTTPLAWFCVPYMTWSIQLYPSQNPVAGGGSTAFKAVSSQPATIAYTPTQAGAEKAQIAIAGTATYPGGGGVGILPANYPYYLPLSVLPAQRLAYLSFDNNFLAGDYGQLPDTANNLSSAVTPFGKGIKFDSTLNVELKYAAFQNDAFAVSEPDGSTVYSTGTPNIRRNEGTIRFWYSPDWSTGSGPVSGGIFLDMVSANWTLQVVDNSGSKIQFIGGGSTLLSQAINFTAGQWYQIAVVYSPSQTILYINGVQAGSIGGGIVSTTGNVLTSFRIGSDGGSRQVRGIMDEVETFNYVLPASQILSDYQAAASVDSDGDGIPDIIEFENGIDPSNPPGGVDNPPTPSGPDSGAPVIQITEPINSN